MPGKKDCLAKVFHQSGLVSLRRRFRFRHADELRVLAYHRVFDVKEETNFPFDLELISASSAEFQRQVSYLKNNFSIVTLQQVCLAVEGKAHLPSRPAMITFDDGHADNYTHAFPILQREGVSATIFLSTDYIGGKDTFWFDKISNILLSTRPGELKVPGIDAPLHLSDIDSRRRASQIVLRHLSMISDQERRNIIELIESELSPHSVVPEIGLSGVLTWDQVREMSDAGIEFGSHTQSHPILSHVDDIALERELTESRKVIEERTGRLADTIAYPVGGSDAFNQRVILATQRAGYRIGFSYLAGTNYLSQANPFSLRRLHVERYTTFSRFCAMLEFPGIFQ